ncbi:MAG: DEAD/DEAH box helicase [Candidatus Magasanikbacteria bacterium]|jgi:ATP-dependent RNA helicase RhlE|nr:DEAD/DEAH box helicase [Candidatus Magasanikbacteria bacterium]
MTQNNQTGLFSDLGIGEKFLAILTKKGFTTPTPIQHQVIPAGLDGKDIIGIAQTGTGKTLAFGIPMIQRVAQGTGQGLVIVPTRELAEQVETALSAVGRPLGLKTAVLIGGTSQYRQVQDLRKNPHIVIATPGRLMDLIEQGHYALNKISCIALDEADRMLDMGFLPAIKKILQGAPQERQTLLFSATMPKTISNIASRFMKIPLRIEVAPQGTSAKNVEQEVFVIRKNDKMRLLESILTESEDKSILIFSRTKHGAKRMARDIRAMGHTATEIHSNRSQAQRKAALAGFSGGRFRVMVATDIAARGIDVKTISLVINFDLPDSSDDYVHRIGRTGRAGRSGRAVSFMCPSQKADMRKIERLMKKSIPVLGLPELPPARPKTHDDREERSHGGGRGFSGGRGRSNFTRGGNRGRSSQSSGNGGGGFSRDRSGRPNRDRENKGTSSREREPKTESYTSTHKRRSAKSADVTNKSPFSGGMRKRSSASSGFNRNKKRSNAAPTSQGQSDRKRYR